MAYPILRQTILSFLRRRIDVDGLENLPPPPYIIACNHVSYLDALIIGLVLAVDCNERAYYLTQHRIYKKFGSLIGQRWLGMIEVPKDDKAAVLEKAKSKIEEGKNVVIFVEGTRSYDPYKLLKGKTGAVRLALATKKPLIPLGVIAPPGRRTKEAFEAFFSPKVVLGLKFGQPLTLADEPADIKPERLTELTRNLMKQIGLLCHKTYPY